MISKFADSSNSRGSRRLLPTAIIRLAERVGLIPHAFRRTTLALANDMIINANG